MDAKRLTFLLLTVAILLVIVAGALISTIFLGVPVRMPPVAATTVEVGSTTILMPTTITITRMDYLTITEKIRESIIERITETSTITITTTATTTNTITRTITETLTMERTVVPISPCPYEELFNKSVSNEEGNVILVWRGNINCRGVLTLITGGCGMGPWYIRVINDGRDSGWIKVPCFCQCNNFEVGPGRLEVWVGWCIKEEACLPVIDKIDVKGILGGAAAVCFC